MSFTDILLQNTLTLFLIGGLALIAIFNRNFDKRNNLLFLCFLAIVFALDLADMGDYYMTQFDTFQPWRYVTSALGYTLRAASLAMVICILLRRKKATIWIWVPVILLAILVFTSAWSHWVFYFPEDNEFHRGPLGYLPLIVSGLYVLWMVYLMIRWPKSFGLGEILIIVFIVGICTFATVMEVETTAKFLLPGAMTISCAVYYVFLYVEVYKRDALTGLLNRWSLYARTEKLQHSLFAVISVDLNGLKYLNDHEGHQEGDRALCELASCCAENAPKNFEVYRTGGDEFILLGKGASQEESERYIAKIKDALGKTKYMASFGLAVSSGSESYDSVCNRADALMYEDKKHYPHRPIEEMEEAK